MASYESYNWDADEKWKEYLQNVTVPASGNEREMMERLRKRYFKKNINPDFDENIGNQPPPASSYTPPPPQPSNTQSTNTQSQTQAQPQAPPQIPQQQVGLISMDNIWVISHAYLIVNAVLFAIPTMSLEFSYGCYRRAVFSGCVAYSSSLYKAFGSGPYRGNARVKDFVYYLLYCAAILNTSSPSLIYIFPLALCSFFMVGDTIVQYASRLPVISILGRLLQKILAYQQQAQLTVGYTELIAFVMSIFQLIAGTTSLITVLTLWQFITYRYQTSAPSRQMIETYMGKLGFLFQHRLVPAMLKRCYENARGFFTNYSQYNRP